MLALVMLNRGSAFAAEISVYLDGKPLTFDQLPVVENDRTMVPLRAVFQALGANVDYDLSTARIVVIKGATVVRLIVGDPNASINCNPTILAVPPEMIGRRTLIPLRFVSDALGPDVQWDGATLTVAIT